MQDNFSREQGQWGRALTPGSQVNLTSVKDTKEGISRGRKITGYFLLLIFWMGLVFAGFQYAQWKFAENQKQLLQYIDSSLQDVKETNALNIQMLEAKINSLQSEMQEISRVLKSADESISVSNATREALNERITDLNRKLEELQHSLEILKGNQNAKN